jgi:hypothetical protein
MEARLNEFEMVCLLLYMFEVQTSSEVRCVHHHNGFAYHSAPAKWVGLETSQSAISLISPRQLDPNSLLVDLRFPAPYIPLFQDGVFPSCSMLYAYELS